MSFMEGMCQELEKNAFMNPGPLSQTSPLGMAIPGMDPTGKALLDQAMPTIMQPNPMVANMMGAGKKTQTGKSPKPQAAKPSPTG